MRLWTGLVTAGLLLSVSNTGLAEGSAEFDSGDTNVNDDNDQAISNTTVMYVDIVDGTNEKICWRGNGSLRVFRPAPNTNTQVANVSNGSCTDAVNTESGAYRLTIGSDQNIGTEWDVRVCAKSVSNSNCLNVNTNERLGRLWSYSWDFNENTSFSNARSVNGSVYAIVPGGGTNRDAVIEMQMRGVSGAYYKITANSIGPETTAGVRVGRSVPTAGHRSTPSFPLYLNLPQVAQFNWIPPAVSNVVLAPMCGTGVVLNTAPGAISFTSNVVGQYVLVCDTDRDGSFNFASATDFSSFGNAVVGTNRVNWNGRNNSNTNVAVGTYQCVVRLNVGEFHYVAEDIETSFPGIRLFRVNANRTTRVGLNMFWDDRGVPADNANMPAPISAPSPNFPVALGLNPGAYATAPAAFRYVANVPTGNARAWGNFNFGGGVYGSGKGNDALLDQFSAADTAISQAFSVTVIADTGDSDNDGLTNARECAIGTDPINPDTDGDGVDDGFEATGSTTPDSDGDGIIDALDTDDDGDGVLTRNELGPNENGDGNPNDAANSDNTGPRDYLDVDSDNDGVCDGPRAFVGVCVAGPDVNPRNPNACRDVDNDNCDDCAVTGANTSGGNPANDGPDSDGDGICNLTDPDDDDDGVCDGAVAVANVCIAGPDTNPNNPRVCADSDGDGCDDCSAGNGPAPMNDGPDSDGDGACNAGDPDDDNDGVPDGMDSAPRNPAVCRDLDADTCNDCALTGANNSGGNVNNDGPDSDGDGLCDAGDPDDDDDGVCDGATAVPGVCVSGPDTDPNNPNVCGDTDLDTCDDCSSGMLATNNDGLDTDADGICNAGDPDDDGDGVCDGATAAQGVCAAGPDTNPTNPNVCADTDQDGCDDCALGTFDPNNDGTDTDNNGQCDAGEDTDGDGIPNNIDLDDDNDGILDDDEEVDGVDADFDGDGIPNRLDLDSDNDGIPDIMESGGFGYDADGDGMVDGPFGANGLADAIETAPDSGMSKLPRIDTDGDGDEDFLDLDSDGDAIFDIQEVGALAEFDADSDGKIDSTVDADRDGLMDVVDARDDERGWPKPITDPRADDEDEDGIPQAYDVEDDGTDSGDSDGDGISDETECPTGWPCRDTNGDGRPDYNTPRDDNPPPPPTDTDGDGVPDDMECPTMPCRDTDGDGTPDFEDPDDDGDGVPTIDERPDDEDVDTDGDGTPDYLDPDDDGDGIPTINERPAGEDVDTDGDGLPDYLDPDDDGDGIPTIDEHGDGNNNGIPDYLEPPRTGTLAGGACAVTTPGTNGSGGAWWLLAIGLGYSVVRRGRSARRKKAQRVASQATHPSSDSRHATQLLLLLLSLSSVVAFGATVHAQVALDQLKATALPSDGFALTRPDTLSEKAWALSLLLDYANDPLVYELRDPTQEVAVVNDQLALHIGAAIALSERITVFATLPINLIMSGDSPMGLAPAADGAGLGDLTLGGRVWLLGETDSTFALSGELIARLPTARLVNSDQNYAGDSVGSYEPALVAELRVGRLDVRVRPGVRLRQARTVSNLKLGSELVYGVGARFRILPRFYAHAELFGSAMLKNFGDREYVPLELLVGAKYGFNNWTIGTAVGPGLTHGYGTPDMRWLLSVAYSPEAEPVPAPEGPIDSDGDGLLDPDDACPQQPEDKDNFEDEDGCPDPDNDQDGVLDLRDQCVMEPEDKDDFEDTDGCPDPDNDQDGVLDVDDRCPLEAEDVDQFEDADGCPDPDNDHDTVLDRDDECPLQPGSPDARGCPKSVRLDVESGRILILDRVEFATNRDVILPESQPILAEVQSTLLANPQLTLIRVEGHTDDVGAAKKNMDLSRRRARSVVRWLVEQGVERARLEAYGCGEARPLAEGKSKDARAQNRRVEFHIVQAGAQDRGTTGCERIELN